MNRDEIRRLLIAAIAKFQEMSGDEIRPLDDNSTPIGDCPGFDSQRGVEVIVELEVQLGLVVPGDANLFVSEDGTRALRIREIVDWIIKLTSAKEGKGRG